jgi:hypothetical protein
MISCIEHIAGFSLVGPLPASSYMLEIGGVPPSQRPITDASSGLGPSSLWQTSGDLAAGKDSRSAVLGTRMDVVFVLMRISVINLSLTSWL